MMKRRTTFADTNRIVHRPNSTASTSQSTPDATTKPRLPEKLKEFMNKPRDILNQKLSLSQLVGRASYLCSMAAFAEADILDLRSLALLSSTFSLSFQWLARPAPQKIPLHWGALLMGINAYMASSLYLERKEAEHMGDELEAIYLAGDFEKRGFGRVEFLKLFNPDGDCSPKKYHIKRDDVLVLMDTTNTKLYYIVEGSACVCVPKPGKENAGKTKSGKEKSRNKIPREGNENNRIHLATIDENEFIGELSMIDALDQNSFSIEKTTAAVLAGDGGITVYEWDLMELRKFMWKNRQVSNALQTYACQDLRNKLRKSTNSMITTRTMMGVRLLSITGER